MLADPMVGHWCRVGSLALTHTHNDIAILVQRQTLLSIFLLFSFFFSLPSMSFVFVAAFLLSPGVTSLRA